MAGAARELHRCNICSTLSKATRLVEVPVFGLLYLFLARIGRVSAHYRLHMLRWMVEMGLAHLCVSSISRMNFLKTGWF